MIANINNMKNNEKFYKSAILISLYLLICLYAFGNKPSCRQHDNIICHLI